MENSIQNFKQRHVMTLIVTLALTLVLASPSLRIVDASPPPLSSFEDAKLLASDAAAGDNFGHSVSVSGDTAVVGAWMDDDNGANSGSAYVFVRLAGVWTQEAKLTASDANTNDSFGWSVSISGNRVIIGAYQDDDNGAQSEGSAYIFVRNSGVWTQEAKLTASDGDGHNFGISVSISDDTAIVGANIGSAYIFRRDASSWTEESKLTASDAMANDEFGWSVSVSGDTAAVGAYQNDDDGLNSGSAYVFKRNSGIWSEEAKLRASDAAPGDFFGYSISSSGDKIVVGARFDGDNGSREGSAYVFGRNGGNWTEEAKLTPSDAEANDQFGWSVSVSADIAVVGSSLDDDNDTNSGSAYVFLNDGSNWVEQDKLLGADGLANDRLGFSVSVSGDTIITGSPKDDDNGSDKGSAYIFEVAPANSAPTIASGSPGTAQGSPSSNQLIATVMDGEDDDDSLSVTINGGASATTNGVTVSNLAIAPNGDVSADIVAADCASSDANFALEVMDSGGLTAMANLSVSVSAETTPPVIDPISDVVAILAPGSAATSAVVSFPNPTATDNCSVPVVTASPVSGSFFPIGETTVTVDAVDDAGNNAESVTFAVRVLYNFAGFFSPIDNMELNNVKAGRGIPIKFSLSGDKGLNILAAGYPASYSIPCGGSGEDGEEIPTVIAGNSSLSYDAVEDQYNYVWKTDKGWKNTCRRLVVQLNDGSIHTADFRFK